MSSAFFTMRSLLSSLSLTSATPITTSSSSSITSLTKLRHPTTTIRTIMTPSLSLSRDLKRGPPKAGSGKAPGKPLDEREKRALARKRRAQAAQGLNPKVAGMMKFLYSPSQTPPPLRMARQRHLRHWTIHRAWQLFRNQREAERKKELMRMNASMAEACEKLRNLEGPGTRPTGWLYRKAMMKVGVWGPNAVPIEYARPLVETPGERPWNHEWKRN